MMKIHFQHLGIFIAFILIWKSGISQKKYLFELPIPNQKITTANFYIGEVKDSRYDTTNVGWVYKGIFNKKIACSIKNGAARSIHQFYQQLFDKHNNNAQKINLTILSLSVNENATFPEIAKCNFKAVLTDANGNIVYKINSEETRRAIDVTGIHPQLIAKTLIKSIELYHLSRTTYQEFIPQENDKNLENKILISQKLQKGFYSSFEELQANNPSIRTDFTIIQTPKSDISNEIEIHLNDKNLDKDKLLDLIWGFSDGQHVFIKSPAIKSKFSFNIIKSIGRYAHFIDLPEENQAKISPILKDEEKEFVMDMKTGRIWSFNQSTLQKILVQDPKIFEIYAKQPNERKELLKDFWLEQFNLRYVKRLKNKDLGSRL